MIFIFILNICPFCGITLSSILVSFVKKQEMETNKKWKLFVELDSSKSTCLMHVCFSWVYKRVEERGTSSVSRSSQILASDYSPEITCTSWHIWNQGLAHCSRPKHPLGVKTRHPPLGLIDHGSPPRNTMISAAAICTGQNHHLFSPPTAIFFCHLCHLKF